MKFPFFVRASNYIEYIRLVLLIFTTASFLIKIDKIQQEEKAKLAAAETEITTLKDKVTSLETTITDLVARLTALETA